MDDQHSLRVLKEWALKLDTERDEHIKVEHSLEGYGWNFKELCKNLRGEVVLKII